MKLPLPIFHGGIKIIPVALTGGVVKTFRSFPKALFDISSHKGVRK